MAIIGKLHEITFYGLITTVFCLWKGLLDRATWLNGGLHFSGGFTGVFIFYLFWSTVLFIPIAIVCAFQTKYQDSGEGLSFFSDNLLVIFFAHIAEEILGLVATPFWFLIDIFKRTLNTEKAIDYLTWLIEIIFIVCGLLCLK